MLYKYIGNKFKINDITIVSNGDILSVKEEKFDVPEGVENSPYKTIVRTIINTNTAKEISDPNEFWFRMTSKNLLVPLDTEATDIDDIDEDKVNHPSHYAWLKDLCGIEVIDITRHMDFDLGNAIKYILRCGRKSENGYSDVEKMKEDLRKASWYINDKINNL